MAVKSFALPTLGKKIAWSTIVQLAGKVVQLVLAAVSLKIISNYLAHGDYAMYASISEFALFLSVAANLGIFGQTVRAMSAAPRDGKTFINALLLRVVTALLFFGTGLGYLLINGVDAVFFVGSVLFAGSLFFDYVTSVCDGMLQANYLMGRATAALVTGRVVALGGIYTMTSVVAPEAAIQNIPLLFAATMGGSVVAAGLSLLFVRQRIKWSWQIDRDFMMRILRRSLPFGVINIFNSLYFRFLPEFFSREILTDEAWATFNISFKIAQVLSLFSTFLMFSVLPGFKQYLEKKDWRKAGILYKRVWMLLVVSGFLLVTVGSLLGPFTLELLTSKKYFIPEFWFLLPSMLTLAAISYGYDLILITLFAMEEDFWLIRREIVAFTLAFALFASSWFVEGLYLKLALILLAAVCAESFMVVSGVLKIRQVFRKKR